MPLVFESDFLMSVEVEILKTLKNKIIKDLSSQELRLSSESDKFIKYVFNKTRPAELEMRDQYWDRIVDRGCALFSNHTERIQLLTDIQWSDQVHCMQYFLYYTSQYVPRIQLDFIDILIKCNTVNEVVVIDIGVGPGTTFVALFSLLEKYNYMVKRSNKKSYVEQIKYYLLDSNTQALEVAQKHVKYYKDCFPETKITTTEVCKKFELGKDNINSITSENNIIVAVYNVLAELSTEQQIFVAKSFSNLPTNMSLMLAEFGGNGKLVRKLGETIKKKHNISETTNKIRINGNQLWYVYQAKLAERRSYTGQLTRETSWTRMIIPDDR